MSENLYTELRKLSPKVTGGVIRMREETFRNVSHVLEDTKDSMLCVPLMLWESAELEDKEYKYQARDNAYHYQARDSARMNFFYHSRHCNLPGN